MEFLSDWPLFQQLGYERKEYNNPSSEIEKRIAYLAMKIKKGEINIPDLYKNHSNNS